ncbi:hypothetical protein V5E97_06710 [Singulisphaera sp. Ch08]|uniref:Uncharacterized protein n=1 Tax=Singulisphaera sp. Ch08 TaxID=3120278 RepID=A0AAU7CL16_9BACT
MAGQGIDLGSIYADLDIRTGNLDQGLAKARNALDAVNKEVKQLQQEFADGAITASELSARMAALGATATELTTRMQAAYAATSTLHTGLEVLNASANQMTQSSGRMGQALMQLGYIADDVQYGFSGIVNNIGPLAYGLGATGGVAAAAQLAAVGIYQLYTHWDQFMELIGQGTVKTEAEEMEALAKATSRTADEQERLNKYKKEEKDIEKMMGGESKSKMETRKAVQDVYSEAGPEVVRAALEKTMTVSPEIQKQIDKVNEEIKYYRENKTALESGGYFSADAKIADLENQRDKISDQGASAKTKQASRLMLRAQQDTEDGQQARDEIGRRIRGDGGKMDAVATRLEYTSPEALKKAKMAEYQAEEEQKKDKAATEEAKRKAKAVEEDREKELGRMGYLEEQAGKRKLTSGEARNSFGSCRPTPTTYATRMPAKQKRLRSRRNGKNKKRNRHGNRTRKTVARPLLASIRSVKVLRSRPLPETCRLTRPGRRLPNISISLVFPKRTQKRPLKISFPTPKRK